MDGRCGGRKDNIVAPRLRGWCWCDRALPTVVPGYQQYDASGTTGYRYIASPGRVAVFIGLNEAECRSGICRVYVDAGSINVLTGRLQLGGYRGWKYRLSEASAPWR